MSAITAPIVEALERALTEPDGLPLVTSKAAPGLFPSTAAGKKEAEGARLAGLFDVVRRETRGKTAIEFVGLTEKGLAALLEHVQPKPVLVALLAAIERCEKRLDGWVDEVKKNRTSLDGLKALAEKVLSHLAKPEATLPPWSKNGHSNDPKAKIVEILRSWHASGKLGDQPLPDLYEAVRTPKLTLGQYHDALRSLHESQAIYLHPWTGPLCELPKPTYSLLVGHEIAYYASVRQ
ncbi:MAG TPA: hypothetical protein VHR72_03340 [Gemmataceae bacterium]|nr:hypothetical protein [Gemmataceae bacterium]